MAIQREFYGERSDGEKLYRTFSDNGKCIVQTETGAVLEDAVDVESAEFTYAETDIPISAPDGNVESSDGA